MRLLACVDGLDGGRDAAALARVLALQEEGSAVVAMMVLYTGLFPTKFQRLEGWELDEARPVLDEAEEILAGVEVETRAYGGGTFAAIVTTLSEQEDFDAIVVGSSHWGPVGRVLVGSATLNLLNGARSDVFVAPKGYRESNPGPPRTIAVAYDGTDTSRRALERAAGLADLAGARVRVIYVAVPPVATGSRGAEDEPDPDRLLDEAASAVGTGLEVEKARLEGSPEAELVAACAEGVDLLALGSRSYGPVARVLLGSVSREVVKKAPCPVLVVQRPG